jgi:hypothetical protein
MAATAPPGVAVLSEGITYAVSRLVDDWKEPREPSHGDLKFVFQKAGLAHADPTNPMGKERRVRHVLSWALEHDEEAGERLVVSLIEQIRACGGFRPESPNYVGEDAIANAQDAFASEGLELMASGELRRRLLPSLDTQETPTVLRQYARSAIRGSQDAALVAGTGKDLLEAVAGYALLATYGSYDEHSNFQTLLGQAFVALDLATPASAKEPGEASWRDVERQLFSAACAVNRLRNREGTGHGRPFLPSLSDEDASLATQTMGTVAQLLLNRVRMHGS